MAFDPKLSDRNIQALKDSQAFVSDLKKEMESQALILKPWKDKIVKYNELYQMVQSNKHYDGLANIFVPEILRAVETVTSNLHKIVFSASPWFEFVGREPTDEKPAIAEAELVKYQMEENNFKVRVTDSFRQLAIAGLTVRKIGWDYEERMIQKKVLDPETGQPSVQKVPETVKDTWTFEGVDLISFLISDISTAYYDINKARWLGEEYFVDPFWVKQRMRRGWFSELYKDKIVASKSSESDYKQLKERRERASGFTNQGKDEKVHIFERWGLLKAQYVYSPEELEAEGLDGEDMVETVCVIANKEFLLKLEINPFFHKRKPYVACPYVPQEFQFAGIGIAQIGEKLQEELNDTRNQTMDNKTLVLNNMWLKERGSGISNKSLRVRPLGIIETNNINGLKPLMPPVLSGVGVNIEAVIKEDLRQSTGASSNLQGIAQAGVGTATEAGIVNKEAFSRLLTVADMYGQLVVKPTLLMAESLNYQFYDHTKVIKIVGPLGVKFKKLEPNELIGNKDIIIHLSTDINDSPDVKRQQLLQFMTIINQMMPEQIQMNWKMLELVFQSFFPGKELSDLYQAPPGMEPLLTAVEEMELVNAEYPVVPKPREDVEAHMQGLMEIFDQVKNALSDKSFAIFEGLIQGYEALRQQMILQMEMQAAQQAQAMAQDSLKKNGTKNSGGQKANGNAFNQTGKPSKSNLRKDIGA